MTGRLSRSIMAAALLATITPPLHAQTPPPPAGPPPAAPLPALPDTRFAPDRLPDPARVMALVEYTTAAQIASLTATPTVTGNRPGGRQINTNWISATFLIGASRLARTSDNPATLAYLLRVADHYNWAMRGPGTARALTNADDQAIGDLYAELYARRRQPGMLMPLRQRLDFTLPYLEKTPAPQRLVWWWCDSLFMAPAVFARMSALTGDSAYLRAMDVQWWRTYDKLWDPAESLYLRDERFLTRRSERGKKIFWGRGNGWVIGGLARVLESMPADFPSRPRYVATFRAMVKRLASLQQPDGLWRTSLLDIEAFPGPETSGSAFYTYAMAWGINHGILHRKTYLPHVQRGWAGLSGHILPSGLLGMVQRAGDQPVVTKVEDTALYGTGGLILAGLEVAALSKPQTALPIAERPLDPGVVIASDIGPNRVARTPAEEAENRRRDAERQSMEDLPYNPQTDDPAYRSPMEPSTR